MLTWQELRDQAERSKAKVEVTQIDHASAVALVRAHHYARGCANTSSLCIGALLDGELVAAQVWMRATAGAEKAAARRSGVERHHVIALSRSVRSPVGAGLDLTSRMTAAARRQLSTKGYRVAVTYSDPSRGHDGRVYEICGWLPAGHTRPSIGWESADGVMRSRHCARGLTTAECAARGWHRRRSPALRRWLLPLRATARPGVVRAAEAWRQC